MLCSSLKRFHFPKHEQTGGKVSTQNQHQSYHRKQFRLQPKSHLTLKFISPSFIDLNDLYTPVIVEFNYRKCVRLQEHQSNSISIPINCIWPQTPRYETRLCDFQPTSFEILNLDLNQVHQHQSKCIRLLTQFDSWPIWFQLQIHSIINHISKIRLTLSDTI